MDVFGRRLTHAIVVMPGFLGWVLIYFATNVPLLMTGRILTGMSAGGTVSLGAIVIGEYTSPENRGMFLNLKTASVCMGSLVNHVLAHFYQWRTISLIVLIPHILALIIIFTWPESPAWLAFKKRFDECEKAFYWLRGKSENSIKELDELIRAQMNQMSKPIKKLSFLQNTVVFLKKFTKKDFLKPTFIIFLGALLIEASGRHLFPAYALDIIGEVTGEKSQSFYYTLALDIIITASATFSSVLVKLMKRRTVLFCTGFAAVFVLAIACTYLYLSSAGVISKDHTWIPIFLFVCYFILANLGCTPIPLALLGELLPLKHRGAGSAVGGVILSLCVNLGLQVTPFLLLSVKVHGTFAILGAIMAILLLTLYFVLPETKDRTLQEIEDYFNYGKFKDEGSVQDDDEEATVKMIGENVVKV